MTKISREIEREIQNDYEATGRLFRASVTIVKDLEELNGRDLEQSTTHATKFPRWGKLSDTLIGQSLVWTSQYKHISREDAARVLIFAPHMHNGRVAGTATYIDRTALARIRKDAAESDTKGEKK